jgi:two-component system, cell cycle sensor histidine kinase and response regulator CckA
VSNESLAKHDASPQASAEHQRAAALELAAETIAFTDPSGRITYVNRAFARLHGLRPGRALPRHSSELAADEESAAQYAELEAARSRGQAWSGVVANAGAGGSRVELHLTTSPVQDPSGAMVGWVEVGRDIGLERAREAQLRHAARKLVAERLAGIVAHDLNNLFTAINGFARLHRGTHDSRSEDVDDLDEIIHATDRGAALVRRVLAFSRRSGARTVPIDVPAAVSEAEPLIRRLLGDAIEVRVESEEVPPVLGDDGWIEEILLNLASNSRDAMPKGGTFLVRVSFVTRAEKVGRTKSQSQPSNYVVLTVSDTGAGMDEATRAHVFEPFFTTKEPGKGTGLGLASVCSIVTEARGSIEVESAPGAGTTFRILLPALGLPPNVIEAPISRRRRPRAATSGGSGEATIRQPAKHPRGTGFVPTISGLARANPAGGAIITLPVRQISRDAG